MKNKIVKLILIILGAITLMLFGLVACDSSDDIKQLTVENAKIGFMKGDEFTTGDDFTVYAEYGDGKKVDVTDSVTVKPERTLDMNVPGDYQITVSYGNKKTVYTIYVNDADDILRKIELDSTEVKKEYELGDTVSFDGLVLTLTYETAQGVRYDTTTASLKDFNVEIKHEDGTKIDDVFTALGTYTVSVSLGSVKASFDVTVENINISTVQSALVVGNFFKNEVASGTQSTLIKAPTADGSYSEFPAFQYNYQFGDNFTYVEETIDQEIEDYRSIDEEGFLNVRFHNGEMINTYAPIAEMMGGASFILWYYGDTKYGAEAALLSLYEYAKVCTNKDLKETVNEQTRTYSFEFSGLVMGSNSSDYFETAVVFTLGEKYNIEHVEIVQYFYENNSAWTGANPTFITDENGITRPNDRFSNRITITADQVAGERTATNPYSREMFKIKSYDLKYKGVVLEDGAVIKCDANVTCNINIANVLPATADFNQDHLKLDYEGNYGSAQEQSISNEHFIVSHSGNIISITAFHGGKWTFSFKTSNTVRYVTVEVKGSAPTTMDGCVLNAASEAFYRDNKKTVELNGYVYFYGDVNQYADATQTAAVTSDNASSATITEAEINGVKCFRFTATQSGVYTVVTTSSVTSGLKCTFTFTVSDMPDFDTLLNGSYTVEDVDGNIYALGFTNSGSGKGSLTVTKTPTEEDGTHITDRAQTATFTYSVNGMEIILVQTTGENLGIDLYVNAAGNLMLEDLYSNSYVLVRA